MITVPRRFQFAALALATVAIATGAHAAPQANEANEAATARHLAGLIEGSQPGTAELTMFFSQMPKGGDLHHHYSGAIYAEQYLSWLDKQNYCVDKTNYRIVTDPRINASQRALAPKDRTCLGTSEVMNDDATYRELLQRWSSKDFDNHGAIQPPPDRQFFSTFGYFNDLAATNTNTGLLTLKQRAIEENVSYIETIFEIAPSATDAAFDKAVLQPGLSDAALQEHMRAWRSALEANADFNKSVAAYSASATAAHAGVDDARFTMRYQGYVLRFLSPSMVFAQMVSGLKASSMNPLIVGLNIVGQESNHISMRDYALHMKMFRFLKKEFPNARLALHAGELALGDVPPEGLRSHIDQALHVAGANRIGHGLDLAHETNAVGIMKTMRERDIPVEINLTSNSFISGIKDQNHPITLYRKYGVPYVISTDDAGVTRHTLTQEYVLFVSRYKPSYAEVKKASYNSVRYAFLPDADKARLKRQLDERFAAFEAGIAALARSTVR
ncbi:MAG TPA: hypothetical protein VK539_23000 [Myxococcaceae bacterium]|nr:hypothetical protein [Myxococcaceae bacterium]